ncbi:DNRLRE domain-containing protein [Streptomyces seoulensis]
MVEAQQQAALQDKRIEVLSDRTEDTSTYVNPDGTLTTESYAGPIRVHQDDGSWKAINTNLTDSGAQLEPEVASAQIALSDGGDKKLASVGDGQKTSFGMDWSSTLPAPDIDGDTASYQVDDGVTLTVQALAQGFEQSIVLASPPDAATSYRIPLDLQGLSLTQDSESGHLQLHNADGKVVADASAPHMWDSSRDPASGEAAHQAEIATSVEKDADGDTVLVLTPDQDFLTDPTLSYPVTLDPIATLAVTTDTWLATNYTDSQRSSTELKAGTYDGGSTVARSYLKFDTSQFAGDKIQTAYLSMASYWSSTCSTSGAGVQVRRITSAWDSSSVTWDTKPSSTADGAKTSTEAYGYSSACPAARQTWQIGGIVQAWVEDGAPNYGIEVRGKGETDSTTWRRYRSANYSDTSMAPQLSVTYTLPEVVTDAAYAGAGNTPAIGIDPVGDVEIADGAALTDFQKSVATITGLTPQEALAEEYEEIGKVISFDLLNADDNAVATVVRSAVGGDVPESVVQDSGATTEKSVLSDGSTLVTNSTQDVDEDGEATTHGTVSTLSRRGQLTTWSSDWLSVDQLKSWAISLNSAAPDKVSVESTVPLASENAPDNGSIEYSAGTTPVPLAASTKAKCQVVRDSKPYKHNGQNIEYSGILNCNMKGKMSFSVGIEQYRGLGIWRSKASKRRLNYTDGPVLGLVSSWHCASGTGTQTYRGKIGTASLRTTSHGTWMKPSSLKFSSHARLTCG